MNITDVIDFISCTQQISAFAIRLPEYFQAKSFWNDRFMGNNFFRATLPLTYIASKLLSVILVWILGILSIEWNVFRKFSIVNSVRVATIALTIAVSIFYGRSSMSSEKTKGLKKIATISASDMGHPQNLKDFHIGKMTGVLYGHNETTIDYSLGPKRDIASVESWQLQEVMNAFYLKLLLSFSVIGVIVNFLYIALMKEYRRFNDKYVELYIACLEAKNKPERDPLIRQLYYLLKEEYLLFYRPNIYYSEIKLGDWFSLQFWAMNIIYAFGMSTVIDEWFAVFQKIDNPSLGIKSDFEIFNSLKELNENIHKKNKNDEFYLFIQNANSKDVETPSFA